MYHQYKLHKQLQSTNPKFNSSIKWTNNHEMSKIPTKQNKVGWDKNFVGLYFYEPCKILAYIKYESKMHPLPTTITSFLMPLQNVSAIETLEKLPINSWLKL
jgi:hypothetical protein